jgi:hypothetical protein
MTRGERANQIWPLLALCANHRQTLTYDQVGRLIGVPRQGLGQLLEPIQSLCILNQWPALTSLVVSEVDGLPGVGFIAAADIPNAHAKVFAFDWSEVESPSAESLERAAASLPSNGKSFAELQSARPEK